MQVRRVFVFAFVLLGHVLMLALVRLSPATARLADPVSEVTLLGEERPAAAPPPQPLPAPALRPVSTTSRAMLPTPVVITEAPDTLDAEPLAEPIAAPQAIAGAARAEPELAVLCPVRTPPAYPPQSRRLREQGEVMLRVELDEHGQVRAVQVLSSSGSPRLDAAARATVFTWRCNPAERDGHGIPAVALQNLEFVLQRR